MNNRLVIMIILAILMSEIIEYQFSIRKVIINIIIIIVNRLDNLVNRFSYYLLHYTITTLR